LFGDIGLDADLRGHPACPSRFGLVQPIVNDYEEMTTDATLGRADSDAEPAGAPASARRCFSTTG